MKKLLRLIYLLTVCAMTVSFVACGEEDDPDSGQLIKPDTNVPDPTGTVTISMRKDGTGGSKTYIDNIYISSDDNFYASSNVWFADLGAVKGLGNVSYIPTAGWASKVAVTPGHGYVAYDQYKDQYYRLFVEDYAVSTTGGIIGADVKYQKPFKGIDAAITAQQSNVTISNEGGSAQVLFTNNSIVLFTVESSEGWCQVQRASTLSESFLYDAIVINCGESFSQNDRTATVTIKTLYGKETKINVTQAARGDYMSLSTTQLWFDKEGNAYDQIILYTNIAPADIDISASDTWLNASITDSRAMASARKVKWVEGNPDSRASEDDYNEVYLAITADPCWGQSREGKITLSHGSMSKEIQVSQQGGGIYLSETSFSFNGDGGSSDPITITGTSYNNLVFDTDASWCEINKYNNNTFYVITSPYYSSTSRSATINVYYYQKDALYLIATINVTQEGKAFEDQYIYFDRQANNKTIAFPIPENAQIKSDAAGGWASATRSGDNLIVRATSTSENRSATITIEGINAKIYVSQSRYAVNDTYSVDGVEGTVGKMAGGVGYIYKHVGEYSYFKWSTETVENLGARSMDDGEANCNAIMSVPGWQELYPAMKLVQDLNTNGVEGWYIPAVNEASCLPYTGIGAWTSTEYSASSQYYIIYAKAETKAKNGSNYVYAVHKFSYDFFK